MLKLADLFSGAGGMTLGFTDDRYGGGFESVWAIDHDQSAVDTYKENFGDHAVCDDIEKWIDTDVSFPNVDVVIGGPPCQGFSLLNKGRREDERRALWKPYLELVGRMGAKVFVIENVKELANSDELGQIREAARGMGFETAQEILTAADYGTPQLRKRAFVIGWKRYINYKPHFPLKTHKSPSDGANLPNWRTVRDAIADLPNPLGTEIGDSGSHLDIHFGRNPTELSKKRYALIPEGGNRFDLQRLAPELTPRCWIKKTSGGTDLFGRLKWDDPSVTIRTEFFKPEKGRYLHPQANRPITHREAARLMGFPDDFQFVGKKVEIARQIGNAVPPHLAGAMSKMVREILDFGWGTRAA